MNIEDVLRSHGVGVGSGGGGSSTSLTMVNYRNTVTIGSALSAVPIGIGSFNQTKDILLVYQNNTYIEKGQAYTVSSDGLSINKTSGSWTSGTTFNFVVISSAPGTDVMTTAALTNIVTVSANNTANIAVGLADYDSTNDVLEVWHDNSLLYVGDQYTASGTGAAASVTFNGFTLNTGEKVMFRVWKRVRKDLSQVQSLYTTVSLTNTVNITTNNNTTVNIGIGTYNQATDLLNVFYKGVLIYPTRDYTIDSSGTFINLVGFTANNTDDFFFQVIKQVLTTMPTYPSNSVTNAQLATDVKVGSLAALTTNTKTDVVNAVNELSGRMMPGGIINNPFNYI